MTDPTDTDGPETEAQREHRIALEEKCAALGRNIGSKLPPGIGFALMMFDFGGKGSFAWISNANRTDMVELLHEAIGKIGGDHG